MGLLISKKATIKHSKSNDPIPVAVNKAKPADAWLDPFVKSRWTPTEAANRAVGLSEFCKSAQRFLLYRLGDMVWSNRLRTRKSPWAKTKKISSDKALHIVAFPFSLAAAYMQCTTKSNNLDTLAYLVDNYNVDLRPGRPCRASQNW